MGGVHVEMQRSVMRCEEQQEVSSDPHTPQDGLKAAVAAPEYCTV